VGQKSVPVASAFALFQPDEIHWTAPPLSSPRDFGTLIAVRINVVCDAWTTFDAIRARRTAARDGGKPRSAAYIERQIMGQAAQ
jgi:hypothetical protein